MKDGKLYFPNSEKLREALQAQYDNLMNKRVIKITLLPLLKVRITLLCLALLLHEKMK